MPFSFDHPQGFLWLLAAAGLAALLLLAERARRRAAQRWADAALLPKLTGGRGLGRGPGRAICVVAAAALMAIALADPRGGEIVETVRRRGVDVFFVVDVSRSMLAEDATPNRLERAKQLVSDAVDRMAGDRVGLIAFAGTPALRSPLTLNHGAFRLALAELSPLDAERGGSLLGDAIRLAATSFNDEVKGGKAIVVLSDGEDMESFPVEAARDAYEKLGVRVFTIGIGDANDGGRIPVGDGARRTWLLYEGQEVWTRMDPRLLTEIALAADGAFIPAGRSLVDMDEVFDATIGTVGSREFEATEMTRSSPQFQWFAGAALLLLLLESFLPGRRGPRTRTTKEAT